MTRRRAENMTKSNMTAGMRELISAWLDWHATLDKKSRLAELADRVEGYRVVNGGQVDSAGSWEITDAETGEVLATGRGSDSLDAAWRSEWVHIDRIQGAAFEDTPEPEGDFGLPPGFAQVLSDWVVDKRDEAEELLRSL